MEKEKIKEQFEQLKKERVDIIKRLISVENYLKEQLRNERIDEKSGIKLNNDADADIRNNYRESIDTEKLKRELENKVESINNKMFELQKQDRSLDIMEIIFPEELFK